MESDNTNSPSAGGPEEWLYNMVRSMSGLGAGILVGWRFQEYLVLWAGCDASTACMRSFCSHGHMRFGDLPPPRDNTRRFATEHRHRASTSSPAVAYVDAAHLSKKGESLRSTGCRRTRRGHPEYESHDRVVASTPDGLDTGRSTGEGGRTRQSLCRFLSPSCNSYTMHAAAARPCPLPGSSPGRMIRHHSAKPDKSLYRIVLRTYPVLGSAISWWQFAPLMLNMHMKFRLSRGRTPMAVKC
jgi:hypothetical protein